MSYPDPKVAAAIVPAHVCTKAAAAKVPAHDGAKAVAAKVPAQSGTKAAGPRLAKFIVAIVPPSFALGPMRTTRGRQVPVGHHGDRRS